VGCSALHWGETLARRLGLHYVYVE